MQERVRKRIRIAIVLCIAAATLAIGIVATLLVHKRLARFEEILTLERGPAVAEEEMFCGIQTVQSWLSLSRGIMSGQDSLPARVGARAGGGIHLLSNGFSLECLSPKFPGRSPGAGSSGGLNLAALFQS